jgi:Fic family protein
MQRGLTGVYTPCIAGGVACNAFVPRPLPPHPALVLDNKLHSRINNAMLALGRLDAVSILLPASQLLLYSYVRKEAVMSSQIEGTQSSLNDLMLYEMQGQPGVPVEDVREVSCHVKALELGVRRIREDMPISYRLLTEIHATLMQSGRGRQRGPGELRRNQVWIGGHSAETAVYVPPPPNMLADSFSALERYLNDADGQTSPFIKAALAHVQFETIHPFLDGNGRLGRMLIPLIMVDAGLLREPLLYLSVFLKRHRQTYYQLLQQVRLQGDWEAWLLFFADAVVATADQAFACAQELTALLASDKVRILSLGRLAGSATQLLDALFARPIANAGALAQATGLAAATIGKVLGAMGAELGIVRELSGQKRNRIYAYSAYIDILNGDDNALP